MSYKTESYKKKYSVALCVYNGEKYLLEQLESIVGQTVPPSEIVVIDDCSSDNSFKLVQNFARSKSHIIWVIKRNSNNVGYVENFQNAIRLCSNDIVFLSDQDDYWLENKSLEILKVFDDTTNVVFTDAEIVDEALSSYDTCMFDWVNFDKPKRESFYVKNQQMILFLENFLATGATMAVKRSFATEAFPVPKNSRYIHDSWLATLSACSGSIRYIAKPLIKYRQHDNNAIGAKVSVIGKKSSERDPSRHDQLLAIIESQLKKEKSILTFLYEKRNLISDANLDLIRERVFIYEFMIKINKDFFSRLKLLFYYNRLKELRDFNTFRKRLRNLTIFIFKLRR